MTTRELTLELPLTVSEGEAKVLFAVTLYEARQGLFGTGCPTGRFLRARSSWDVLGQHKVPVFNYAADDLAEELGSVKDPVVADHERFSWTMRFRLSKPLRERP